MTTQRPATRRPQCNLEELGGELETVVRSQVLTVGHLRLHGADHKQHARLLVRRGRNRCEMTHT